jgi:two-component system, NarL family, invasion response regulator UvrY
MGDTGAGDGGLDAFRVGIVEDHRRYREALEATIAMISGITVGWVADDSGDALEKMTADQVDLLIVDLSIPGESGIWLLGRLRETWPDVTCIVVSGHTEVAYVRRAFDAGASAYVVKGRPADLRAGIAAARRGERFVSPALHMEELGAGGVDG